ncbi:MAG: cytochrome c3 family protein [Myxococcota bacterium]
MKARMVVVAGALVLAVGGACSRRLLTRFPHELHLAEIECGKPGAPDCLSCNSCHAGTPDQATWVKPTQAVCAKCHEESQAKYAIATRPDAAARPAAYDIRFGHDKHLKMPEIKGQCVKCHAGAVQAAGGKPLFPPMNTCRSCHRHEEQFAANDCAPCHKPNHLRGLKPLSFLSHDANWLRRHGTLARDELAMCTTCHAQAQCDSCHDATQTLRAEVRNPDAIHRQYVHRFDFLSRHAIEAQSEPAQCVTCHQKQDCDACHMERGVSGGLLEGRNPHPPNWSGNSGAATNLHGPAARRDTASCAACHEQGAASNCVRCHKVGGFGGNPHPPGWRSSLGMDSTSCAVCHGGAL